MVLHLTKKEAAEMRRGRIRRFAPLLHLSGGVRPEAGRGGGKDRVRGLLDRTCRDDDRCSRVLLGPVGSFLCLLHVKGLLARVKVFPLLTRSLPGGSAGTRVAGSSYHRPATRR